jgi:threonine dehydratase
VIVMPERTARIKVDAVARLGAQIVLHGDNYDAAYTKALEIAASETLEFIHPFADPDVIAGQGTIAREIARTWSAPPAAIFVPIGGGGLISGIGVYMKQHHPTVRIIGVEPQDAASMQAALAAGGPVELDRVGTFADGVAVRRVAERTFRICSEVVDEIVLVDTDEICAAIKDIFEDCRVVTEPAGALAVAGLKKFVERAGWKGERLVAVASGANMDFTRLRHVVERAEIGEHREALLAVTIPERKGAFIAFCRELGERNITEFNYRFASTEAAHIFVGVSLTRADEAAAIAANLADHGYTVADLTDNEVAKLHIRHTVGGFTSELDDERLYRFEFPERPGALLEFLSAVGLDWNITLFHYRNHGSDYGRVLAGIQVPDSEEAEFTAHLQTLGYPYWDETQNPAFRLFLNGGG